jgi:serine/threonine protein kinase
MLSMEGRQLGNYDVIRRIRTGGMGAVYEGRQRTAFGRRVAIKVILGTYATDPDMRRRFAREARTVARLHHPHILPLIEFGDEQGVLYLVMPFIEGGTLTGYLRRHLPDVNEVSTLFLQLLDAVEYAHEEGLIHRDIKSSNVLLEARRSGPPYAYLADFGLVRTIQQAEIESSYAGTPIPLEQVPGTPHYMAPEQTRGIVTTATDIYALGVLLYQMLTGELPYNDPDDVEVIKMHLHAPVPNPCAEDASIPTEVGAVVTRAMAKRAEQRFPDVTAFREAFLAAIDGPVERVEDLPFTEEAEEDAFEVHELPPRPAAPPQPQLRPSQQLRHLAPEPIEFVEPLPPKASARRPRSTGDYDEAPQSAARRSRITGDPNELPPAGQRRPRITDENHGQTLPRIAARQARIAEEKQERAAQRKTLPLATARLRAQTGIISSVPIGHPRTVHTHSKRQQFALLVGITVTVLLILLLLLPRVFGLALFPSGFPLLGSPPVATISLSVKSQNIQDTFLLTASPQTTQVNVSQRVMPDRSITTTTKGSSTIATSGQQTSDGTRASGTLLFVNSGPTPVNITDGFTFTASNGVQIRLDQKVIVPPHDNGNDNSVSAQATAISAGQNGNIAAEALNTPCCGGLVVVSNPQPFSGGTDGGVTHLVAQSDLDSVKNALLPGLQQKAQQQILSQIQSNEVQAGTPTYSIHLTSDHQVGDQATQVNVTVTVTAAALLYNARVARDLASQLLSKEAAQSLGSGYQPASDLSIATPVVEQQGTNGQLYLSINASGVWSYHLNTQTEEQWRQTIKGTSLTLAQTYLTTRAGIIAVHIQLPFGTSNLPTDENQIIFIVQV